MRAGAGFLTSRLTLHTHQITRLKATERALSIAYRDAAWRVKLKSERKLVLLFLAERADEAGICFPSMTMISEACGITYRGAEKIIAAFIAGGILERISLGGGRGNPSTYRMLIPAKTPNVETPNGEAVDTGNPEPYSGNGRETPNPQAGFSKGNPELRGGVRSAETPNGETETPNEELRIYRTTVIEPSGGGGARAREDLPASLDLNPDLDAMVQAVADVTNVQATSWQQEGKLRGKAIELCRVTTPDRLRELHRNRGRPYKLNFVVDDVQHDLARAPAQPQQNGKSDLAWFDAVKGKTLDELSPEQRAKFKNRQ